MKVLLFGASGMVGHGVLRECLLAADVEAVTVVGRTSIGVTHAKLREVLHADFTDFSTVDLSGHGACFYTLGVSSAGMTEEAYSKVTYDYTMAVANAIVSPGLVFVFVSGAGTDGKSMWARVKKRAEDALLAMPFRAAYMFRPGGIQPRHGARSKTRSYRIGYIVAWPVLPLLKLFGAITTTERVGLAMLNAVRRGAPKHVLGNGDINRLARDPS
jgi:uncharacterized protein YbjT (DUF2867 family)